MHSSCCKTSGRGKEVVVTIFSILLNFEWNILKYMYEIHWHLFVLPWYLSSWKITKKRGRKIINHVFDKFGISRYNNEIPCKNVCVFIYKIENLYSLEMILKINIRIDALVYFLSKSFFVQHYIVMKSFLWFDCTFT